MKKLQKEFEDYESKYKTLYDGNNQAENDFRDKYKKIHRTYRQNMKDYDTELKN